MCLITVRPNEDRVNLAFLARYGNCLTETDLPVGLVSISVLDVILPLI